MADDRILLGMNRSVDPPNSNKMPDGSYAAIVLCRCGAHLWTVEGVQEHWMKGHMDTPVYATREEILDRVAAKIAEQIKP